MIRSFFQRAPALTFASLAVAALTSVHCGGKSIGEIPTGSSCPTNPPNAGAPSPVRDGDACAWGGSCSVPFDPCNNGHTLETTCDCIDGHVQCPVLGASCPVSTCPAPSEVVPGGACGSVDKWCASSTAVFDCNGHASGVQCECQSGAWNCESTGPKCPPPPPTTDCQLGAQCLTPGATCKATGAGKCGTTMQLTCAPNDTWQAEVDLCKPSDACSIPTGSCGMLVCSCSQGALVCMQSDCIDAGPPPDGGFSDGGESDGGWLDGGVADATPTDGH